MKVLIKSGLPIKMDLESCKLSMENTLLYADTARKNSDGMAGLLSDPYYNKQEPFYDFYKGVAYEKDVGLFKGYGLRYDLTVIMPGTAGEECKKTAGHYHENLAGKQVPHPEIYEVINGKAMFILQKVNDIYAKSDIVIEEVIIAEVSEGQRILIPPAYGHVSVNIGEDPLVFADLVADNGKNTYDSVKAYKGMSYFINKKNGKIQFTKNASYRNVPEAKFLNIKQDTELGINFDVPVYDAFIKQPEKFGYLLNPENYIEKMQALLITK